MGISKEQLADLGLLKRERQETSSLDLSSIKNLLEQQRKLPREQQDYIYIFFLLEQYILKQNPNLTKKDIRDDIKTKFNTAWFSPKIAALFKLQNPDPAIFTLMILESLLKTLQQRINPTALQKVVNESSKEYESLTITITKENLNLSKLEHALFYADHTEEQFLKVALDTIASLYNFSRNNLGASATEKLFSAAFQELKTKYTQFPAFIKAVKSLPHGILEKERLDLLSKEELEKVSRRLQQIDTMKSDFTNIAAHELKTPIIPMKGYLAMMRKDPKKYGLNKKGLECINIFWRNTNRIESLVTDILDISKLEAGEMKFQMKTVILTQTINEVIADLQPLAKEKNVSLKATFSPKGKRPVITADPKRLAQVISNLVKNAINFTEKGSVTVKVTRQDDTLNLFVTDTGTGIAKADIQKIFEKFYQAQDISTRKTKGTGLGLAIAKKIVEAHNGTINVTSPGKGKGSTFRVTLPIKEYKN